MPKSNQKMRVAMPVWEIGRANSGLGIQIGELGSTLEELSGELTKAAAKRNVDLEIELLSPCFAHYDKKKLTKLKSVNVVLDGKIFDFELYKHVFPDGQTVIYFWDDFQLGWTDAQDAYPNDPQVALRLYATMGQAMAEYIRKSNFDTIHLHDHHVGLIPFYLGDKFLEKTPIHLTVHNASYQGTFPLADGVYSSMVRLNLTGDKLYDHYFSHFGNFNIMKGCMQKVHEVGGKITTINGDLECSWGYAAELKMSPETIRGKILSQKGTAPSELFVPNGYLDLFEKLPVIGITNGLNEGNRPEKMLELKADMLQSLQTQRGGHRPIFYNPTTQQAMLSSDHNFDINSLDMKVELRRLLHLEAFGNEPHGYPYPILLTFVDQQVASKNLRLIGDVIERVLEYDHKTKFIIMASTPEGDQIGKSAEAHLFRLADLHEDRVYFNNSFNPPLSKLILAGGDFFLLPSRFQPCGTIDYEASLMGNVVIGNNIGGVTKVRNCAHLYEWYDVNNMAGEANILFQQITVAVDNYRKNPTQHANMMRAAMSLQVSWDDAALRYIDMYRYGLLNKRWQQERQNIINQFIERLGDDKAAFTRFFMPDQQAGSDNLDWQLKHTLDKIK